MNTKFLKQTTLLALAALMASTNALATPRSEALTDTFNRAAGKTSTPDRIEFKAPEPSGWRGPSFERASDQLTESVRKYNITSPNSPHSGYKPPPNVPAP